MSFGFDGAHGTDIRPAHKPAVKAWAKDATTPDANDGTRLTAALINMIVANLRVLATRNGVTLAEGSDDIVADAVDAAIAAVTATMVETNDSLAVLADGGGFVRMTDAERSKLAALTLAFRGVYVDLAALATAVPAGNPGDWAILTNGAGSGSTLAVWDSDDTPAAWVDTGETGSIPAHGHAIAEITGLQAALDAKAALAHTHAQSDITGLVAALAALAPLAGAAFTGDVDAPSLNATTALKKKGVAGRIVVDLADEVWTTGFTTASTSEVDAWTSAAIVKAAAQGDAGELRFAVSAQVNVGRLSSSCGASFTLYVSTHDGSAWSAWTSVASRTTYLSAGSVGNAYSYGSHSWLGSIDLVGKTQVQFKIGVFNMVSGSTPSLTLVDVHLKCEELL
jgi:hypothetical protein